MRRLRLGTGAALVCTTLGFSFLTALPGNASAEERVDPAGSRWVTSWSRPQHPSALALADLITAGRAQLPLIEQTVRVPVRLTGGGTAVRVTLANRYGSLLSPNATAPLRITSASVARRSNGAAVDPASIRPVTFDGARATTLAPGASITSDPISIPVETGEDLAVSVHVPAAILPPLHALSYVTSYVTLPLSGDKTRSASGTAFKQRTSTTPVVTRVDVLSDRLAGAIAVTGGSVVDGTGSTLDGYDDLPSQLSRRISSELSPSQQRTVLNHGIAMTTGARTCSIALTGQAVEQRLAQDTLTNSGVTHLLLVAGTNDLGFGCSAADIIKSYRSVIGQARDRGIEVLIATITPRSSYSSKQDAQRALVNQWTRAGGNCGGECAASVDFDLVLRDPNDPNRIAPALDSGDGIHPNPEGYRREAAAVPLDAFS